MRNNNACSMKPIHPAIRRRHVFELNTNRNKVMKLKVKDTSGIHRTGKSIHLLVPKICYFSDLKCKTFVS